MSLTERIRTALTDPLGRAADTVSRITAELDDLRRDLEAKEKAYRRDLLADADGERLAVPLEKTRSIVDAAREKTQAKAEALAEAQARCVAVQAEAVRRANADRWGAVEAAAAERAAAVAKLASSSASFAADYHALVKATNELNAALPEKPDMDGAMLRTSQIDGAVRMELRRQGIVWAADAPFGVAGMPSIMERFSGCSGVVKSWRDQALARSN